FDASTLRGDARTALDADAKVLRSNPGAKVVVEGHCDERGTVEYNQALGEQRANAAKEYLVAQGIDAGRMQVISYGKERPFSDGHDESAWQQNRRAPFRLARWAPPCRGRVSGGIRAPGSCSSPWWRRSGRCPAATRRSCCGCRTVSTVCAP